jgi:hypothetical protein
MYAGDDQEKSKTTAQLNLIVEIGQVHCLAIRTRTGAETKWRELRVASYLVSMSASHVVSTEFGTLTGSKQIVSVLEETSWSLDMKLIGHLVWRSIGWLG